MGLRLAGPSERIAKRVFGEDCTGVEAADMTLVARRNNSLSSGGRLLVLGSLAAVVLAFSLGFALSIALPILPFAGMELLAVRLAFRYMEQHAGDYECITVHDNQVVIERRKRGRVRRLEFNRHWAQLIISEPRGIERGRFALRSHGKKVELGMFLSGEQFVATVLRIKEHLKCPLKRDTTLGEA